MRAGPIHRSQILAAADRLQDLLWAKRNDAGWWTGNLSTSALATATAVMALLRAAEATPDASQRARWNGLVENGLQWLAGHQNADGGWGDTVLSISNISTTMLAHAVFYSAANRGAAGLHITAERDEYKSIIESSSEYIRRAGGVPALIRRYGRDRTFSIPILTHCALAGTVEWKDVIPLPFELACVPHRFYAAVKMPVVSYALPALIAIGQVIYRHRGHWNPLVRWIRRVAVRPSLNVLESIQPSNGGFLEATPLTSFVCMSLLGSDLFDHVVTQRCLRFIEDSVRDDGSWPIDTNLTTWVSTLSVNAMEAGQDSGFGIRDSEDAEHRQTNRVSMGESAEWKLRIRKWLVGQQYRVIHPYTHAAPGGWSWTDLPGGVPDADDTPGAMLALMNLRDSTQPFSADECQSLHAAAKWLLDLQNRDGGWPTFCRGWGTLPFDRSSCDLTAHALRALHRYQDEMSVNPTQAASKTPTAVSGRIGLAMRKGLSFLAGSQREDGTWLPLWFGHQFNADDQNPLYGTSRVVRAMATIGQSQTQCCQRAVTWLLQNQNDDGGWAARRDLESSVEETGLALESLASFKSARSACDRAAEWLAVRVNEGTVERPSPIGFYFARLWYFEELYPIIFATAGLNRWRQYHS